MRVIVLVLSIICLFICGTFEKNYFNHRNPIRWHERNKLYANDFTHLLKPYETETHLNYISKDSLKLLKNFAWVSSTIQFENQSSTDSTDIAIFTLCNPEKSYLHNKIDTTNLNRYLITHEEYHFHIAEVVARKVRSEIINSLPVLTEAKKKAILNSGKLLLDSLDEAYDTYAVRGQS